MIFFLFKSVYWFSNKFIYQFLFPKTTHQSTPHSNSISFSVYEFTSLSHALALRWCATSHKQPTTNTTHKCKQLNSNALPRHLLGVICSRVWRPHGISVCAKRHLHQCDTALRWVLRLQRFFRRAKLFRLIFSIYFENNSWLTAC